VPRPDGETFQGGIQVTVQANQYASATHSVYYTQFTDAAYNATGDIYLGYSGGHASGSNTAPGNYIKLRDASYVPRSAGGTVQTLINVMPIAPQAFDSTDRGPLEGLVTPGDYPASLSTYAFSTGATGVTMSVEKGLYSNYAVGHDARVNGYVSVARNLDLLHSYWTTKRAPLIYTPGMTVPRGATLILLTDASGNVDFPAALASGGGYTATPLNQGVVMIVENRQGPTPVLGNLTIRQNITGIPSIALLANRITLDPSVTQLEGIYSSKIFESGTTTPSADRTTNPGLKITGNLVVQDTFTYSRYLQDRSRPALYVQYSGDDLISLLPVASSSIVEWLEE
jgi:hypothetical protein